MMPSHLLSILLVSTSLLGAAPYDVRLPTKNDFLFQGKPEQFYMYVDRNFEGKATKAWEGGCYGFVRSPIRVGGPEGEIVMTKFHEGIDIAPLERDKAGNPLDIVNSISDGTVAYISPVAGQSNYGKYVVVEHRWEGTTVYSIYAHLSEITCKVGDPVKTGAPLARMGFTGAGIDRTRSHVHLEIVLMLSGRYDDWNKFVGGAKNVHGNFNGMNFSGVDAGRYFQERKKKFDLSFPDFVASTPVYFKVTVPSNGVIPDFARRYNWLLHGDASKAISWEIAFSATGQPISFTASERKVDAPLITYVTNSTVPHRLLTRGLLTGEGQQASLSNGGKQLVALVSDEFPIAPAEKTAKAEPAKPPVKAPARPDNKLIAKPVAKPASTPASTSKPKPAAVAPSKPKTPAKPAASAQ